MVEGKTGAGAQLERASHPAAHAPHTSLTSRTSRRPPRPAARRGLSRPLCLWQCPSLAQFLLAFLPALRLPERLESSSLASRKALALSTPKPFPLCSHCLLLFHSKTTPRLSGRFLGGLERIMITLKARHFTK